ncbi:MAG TPA: ankyrin repeat domain-containing protein [Thermoanaerobaculia bacterium]|nr:ankyrin repeat domain-containing protein [Thermoanaerobaculia bacterium]
MLLTIGCGRPTPSSYTEAEARTFLAARGFEPTTADLARAVDEDALDVVAALLALGLDPDAFEGRALASAARAGRLEMMRLLLDAGADPNLGGADHQGALAVAVIHHQREAVDLLIDQGADVRADPQAGDPPLLFAVDLEIAERLLDAGAPVDARDARGGTALMGAIMVGDLDMVDLLLERNADPDATDTAGRSAMLYATLFRSPAIQERLLAAGADRLPSRDVAIGAFESYVGRYGDPDGTLYQIVANPGRLLLIERGADGLLFTNELVPLSATRFFRANDPGAIIFEIRLEDGRVTGLAHTEHSGWVTFPRLPTGAS